MLFLDSPLVLRGLHVFRDFNDRSRFYFLPDAPRLAIDAGHPMFQLILYREAGAPDGDVRAGGFLAMTVDLGVSTARLDQVRQDLSSRFGVSANLAPVPVTGGSVRVAFLDSGSIESADDTREVRFVEQVVAAATPSLYGDERAAFTAELTRAGAAVMKAAIRAEGATPVVVIYELQYQGLMPASDVTITIDFRQSYDYLRERTQLNTLWFKQDVDREMETLRKDGAIRIEAVSYETESPEDRATRMTELNALAKELAQWAFFKPALNPGAVLAADRGVLAAYDATTDLTTITAGLTSTSRAALTGVGATEDVGAPRRPGTALATTAVEDGATTPTATVDAAPADSGPPTAVEAWNRAGRPQGAYLLRQLSQDERQTVTYEMRQVRAVERTIAPQGQIRLLDGAADLPGRILEVDLTDDFFKTIEGSVTTSADLTAMGVASAVVKLRYGMKPDGRRWKDETEVVLRAPGDAGRYRFFVDHLRTSEIEYQVVLTNRPDSAIGHDTATEESPWIPTTTRNLDINPITFSSVIRVHVEAAMVDWEMVRQVQARIAYADAASGIAVADTKILTRETPSALVPIRPKDARRRTVSVEATYFYADDTEERVELTHDGGEPFILNQPPDSTTVVDLTLADIVSRYQRVSVQLGRPTDGEPTVQRTVTLGPEAQNGTWSFRRAGPEDVRYAYRTTAFLKDGAVLEGTWQVTDNPLLVVGDRAAGVLTVRVVVLGSLAEAGLRMAKVDLHYPEAPEWADGRTEQLLKDGATEFVWRVPMSRPDATSYSYTVTWFRTDGERVTSGPTTSADEILLLDPLSL